MESKYLKIGSKVSFKPAGTRATTYNVEILEIHPFGFFGQQPGESAPVRLYTWNELDEFTIQPDKPKATVSITSGKRK